MQFMKYYSGPCAACGCPVHELLPDLPATLPFDLVPENQQQIQYWLLQHFGASAFNVCETQRLPLINSSPPLKLLVDPKAKPVAVHRASPVPVHWMAKVKADLDRDVALGVLERVPENTPVKWQSRMHVVPKKDGTCRRTVDLRPLN